MSDKYILVGKIPVAVSDLHKWADWFETADRKVASTKIGPLHISTVFLSLNHSFGTSDAPILFETMIFGADELHENHDCYCDRYATWDEAERGHEKAVAWAKEHFADALKGVLT